MPTRATTPMPLTVQPVLVEPTLLAGRSSSMREGQTSTRFNLASETLRKRVWQDSSISRAMTPIHYRLLHRYRQTAALVTENSLSIRKVEYSSIAKRAVILTHPVGAFLS